MTAAGTTIVPSRSPSSPGSAPFVVELDRFQGPLDLLLHLIRSQDIDIFDIPIARITQQFQRAIETGLERMELDRAGEFLELAATLVRVKVQLLLPRPGELDWEEDPRAELVRRLLEYEYFQEVARVLGAAEAHRSRHFGKGWVEPRSVPEAVRPELRLELDELLSVARELPEPSPPPAHRPPSLIVTVEEKIGLLRDLLAQAKRLAFERLFSSWSSRPHVVAALLACLELARRQRVRIQQAGRFGAIWLVPGPRAGEEEAAGEAETVGEEPEAEGASRSPPVRKGGAA